MRAKRCSCLLAAVAVIAVAAGCATSGGGDTAQLKEQLCTEADLGGSYIDKTSGAITVQNLADLSDNTSARKKQLEAAGVEGGRFAYWEHTVPNPPFNPPLEVVCQALEFGSPTEAAAYIRDLKPTPDDLASTAMAWLANGHRSVEEVDLPVAGDGQLALPRAFKITASGSSVDFTIYVSVQADGAFVRTIYVGKQRGGPAVTFNDAANIGAAINQRLYPPTPRSKG